MKPFLCNRLHFGIDLWDWFKFRTDFSLKPVPTNRFEIETGLIKLALISSK